jgi:hypothetical protein
MRLGELPRLTHSAFRMLPRHRDAEGHGSSIGFSQLLAALRFGVAEAPAQPRLPGLGAQLLELRLGEAGAGLSQGGLRRNREP